MFLIDHYIAEMAIELETLPCIKALQKERPSLTWIGSHRYHINHCLQCLGPIGAHEAGIDLCK